MKESKRLKRSFVLALLMLLCALGAAVATTMAWYLYTVNAHTTRLHMAAGTNVSLQISNSSQGDFSSSVALEKFSGLLTPVSTDRIQNGFQKVAAFYTEDSGRFLARFFSRSPDTEYTYYKTSLYFRSSGDVDLKLYLADIGFRDSKETLPVSSAIRVGFVLPSTGEEYIYEITDKTNPEREYNTFFGQEGCVLDSTRTDGSVVAFVPLNRDNYCSYDAATGTVTLKESSRALCTVHGDEDGQAAGAPVQVDVYIWLEGCDADCVNNLGDATLTDLALSFVGIPVEETGD